MNDHKITFANREDWGAWLGSNGEVVTGVWLRIAKKSAEQPTLTYAQALDLPESVRHLAIPGDGHEPLFATPAGMAAGSGSNRSPHAPCAAVNHRPARRRTVIAA